MNIVLIEPCLQNESITIYARESFRVRAGGAIRRARHALKVSNQLFLALLVKINFTVF
jgi:hypothetical protein